MTSRASGTAAELRQRQGGAGRVIAEMKGPQEAIIAAVGKMNGVSGVHCEAVDGWTRLVVDSKSDQREALAQLASEKHWPLRELRREIASLEDFFVKIVTGGSE